MVHDTSVRQHAGPNSPLTTVAVPSAARRLSFAQRREIVLWRREAAALEAAGYRRHETDWEIHRGSRFRDHIVDVKISRCGKYVYTKLSEPA